ncbi:MAG: sulfatase [Phycisphaeraceae bacterium]
MFHRIIVVIALVASSAFAADRPNILFIAVDDLRPEIGCYGAKHMKTPHIDALAARGMVFKQAYCQQAVCSPSRTSLMTGLRPDATKVYDLETHFRKTIPDVVTLPQHLQKHGYHAMGMGKIYHGGLDDKLSWSEPHKDPREANSKVTTYALAESNAIIRRKQAEAKEKGLKGKDASRATRGPAVESADVPDNAYHDGALADLAITSLRELKEKEQPFFLAVGFIRPHLPFVAPKKYWDLYDRAAIKVPSNKDWPKGSPDFAGSGWGELRQYEPIPDRGLVSDAQAKELIHGYYAAVSYMDAQLGRVMAELDKLGLRENTIIILWGDHGWKLGEHGAWCKHTNFELDAHAPLIVSVPGMKQVGGSTSALVEFVDIYPSLCDLAGVPLPKGLEGTSFKPLLENPKLAWKSSAWSQYPRGASGKPMMGYAMKTERYRYVRWVNRRDANETIAVELYDHEKDLAENVNVANDAAYSQVMKDLGAQFEKGWRGAMAK